jgi:hypothetical protein
VAPRAGTRDEARICDVAGSLLCVNNLKEVRMPTLRTLKVMTGVAVTLATIAVPLQAHVWTRDQSAKVAADTRAIATAVALYAAHMGVLPTSLEQLTDEVVNLDGEVVGPFLGSLPTPPAGTPPYRYETRPDGGFRIIGQSGRALVEVDGRSGFTAAP